MALRRYRYFVTIVDAGSITRAAEQLHIAQPALSQQLHLLEDDLGVKLLERTPRGIVPTEAGARFYERSQMLLRLENSMRQELRELDKHPSGYVSIGIPSSTAIMLAVPILEAVRATYPDINLYIMTGVSGRLEPLLHSGQLDMAILFQTGQAGLGVQWIFDEALYLMAPPSLQVDDPFPIEDVSRYPMILPSAFLGLRTLLDGAFARHGVKANVISEIDGSIPTINTLVSRGVGCSILPWATFSLEAGRGEVKGYRIEPEIWRPVALCRPKVPPLSRPAKAVYELLRKVIAAELKQPSAAGSVRMRT
ncbi:LysR substrate-binding domain-containing protein [Pollutimonas bauzanensis]|uniref:LysR family transcriptional regulator, nitrogen assimilation regulatory protein n=1 Tax=Pollutimonas bauzanensis TaxID=658167 RepID=A0A1M5UWX4_9BURK|nr:LysR substrate-binding domain-containing protein [Pollutimonas bauzanensis]SHH67434.1 LysR family transcriptional regulator, nitrogen assimilation regulatory protein [Pollutimonas bauzanensis]